MNEKQKDFIKGNKEMLQGIYQDRIDGIMEEILEMESSDDRSTQLDTLRALKNEYKMFGFIGESKGSKPEQFT